METCKNCFSPIEDMRKETRCAECSAPLHKDCAINDGGTFCDVCYTVKEESGYLNKDETIQFDVIRRSNIETYRACPFKFYNEVVKGFAQPPTIYTQLGIDLHVLFDKAGQNKDYTLDDMMKDFKDYWKGYSKELFGDVPEPKMYNRGINSIETYYHVTKDMPEPYRTEETIQFSIGEGLPLVQTTSDRVNLVDGMLEMFDWKTGAVMVGQKLSTDLQAPLYIYGVRDKHKMPIRKFTFHYLDENKERVFERVDDDNYECVVNKRIYKINITDGIREVQTIFSHIKNGDFNIPRDTKGMRYTCKWCHLKAKEICKGADIESWGQYNGR